MAQKDPTTSTTPQRDPSMPPRTCSSQPVAEAQPLRANLTSHRTTNPCRRLVHSLAHHKVVTWYPTHNNGSIVDQSSSASSLHGGISTLSKECLHLALFTAWYDRRQWAKPQQAPKALTNSSLSICNRDIDTLLP